MKRFDIATKVLNDELLRQVGKSAQIFVEWGRVELAVTTKHVKNLKRAIQILNSHEENKSI